MNDLLTKILASPATAYLLSFGGLGILLVLALNSLHRFFKLSERAWGVLLLLSGAVGGLLLCETGLVTLPGNHGWEGHLLSLVVGAATAAAAAGFSQVDLRRIIKKQE